MVDKNVDPVDKRDMLILRGMLVGAVAMALCSFAIVALIAFAGWVAVGANDFPWWILTKLYLGITVPVGIAAGGLDGYHQQRKRNDSVS